MTHDLEGSQVGATPIDLLWREFFASVHTDTAHKTQYVGMAILCVFWGQALVPDLDALYHALHTVSSGGRTGDGVGWDWAIELLNHAIKSHVGYHVSEEQITNFVRDWPFARVVALLEWWLVLVAPGHRTGTSVNTCSG